MIREWLRSKIFTCLAASVIFIAPAIAPWAHVGCEHAHSHAAADSHSHHGHACNHHHGQQDEESDSPQISGEHQHDAGAESDCAACRVIGLAAIVVSRQDSFATELVTASLELDLGRFALDAPHGLYLSRGPPRLA